MSLDPIIHPHVSTPDTDDTKYDKYGRVAYTKSNGVWNIKMHKDLKKTTPDNSFSKGMEVVVDNKKSLYGIPVNGTFLFDSYDAWDNTCFISTDKSGAKCYWMSLNDIKKID